MVHLRLRELISTAKGGTRATCFGEMSPTHHALAGFHLDDHVEEVGGGAEEGHQVHGQGQLDGGR